MTLDGEDIEAIVSRLVEVLPEAFPNLADAPAGLVDAAHVAKVLKLNIETVWRNAEQLGGVRIGDGPRPRWRFDLAKAQRAHEGTAPPHVQAPRRSPRAATVRRLPVRG